MNWYKISQSWEETKETMKSWRNINKMTLPEVNAILSKCYDEGDVISYTYHMAKKRKIELENKVKN